MTELRTELARFDHAKGLDELFQAAGSPCYCRFWHFNGTNNEWLDICANTPKQNADGFFRALETNHDEARGIVAIDADQRIVGWLKVAPTPVMRKAYERRFYKQLPVLQGNRDGVFLIACGLVHPASRKQGVAKALVAAAVKLAPTFGATVLEALPCRPNEPVVMDEVLWTGPMGAYLTNGFVEVGGFDMYPVLRRELVNELVKE